MSRRNGISLAVGVLIGCLIVASISYVARAGKTRVDENATRSQELARTRHQRGLDFTEEELRDVIDAIHLHRITMEADLTQEQLAGVLPRWRRLVEMRRTFWSDRDVRLEQLSIALSDAEGATSSSTEFITEAAARFHDEEEKFWSEHRATEKALLDLLSPIQSAKYILLATRQLRNTRRVMRLLRRANDPQDEPRTHPPTATPD